jgi:RNA polymerase sigma-70 factor (ECF subfamily)
MATAITALESSRLGSLDSIRTYESSAEAYDCRHEFEEVVVQHLPRFRRMAKRWLGNREDAEDAVQEAMLSAFTHIERFGRRAKMSTWVTAIVINAVRMQIRRRYRGPMLSLDWTPKEGESSIADLLVDPRPTPESILEQSQIHELLVQLIQTLPPSQKAAVQLRREDQSSIKKAAANLGVPEGTLKAQLARGRAKLVERFRRALARPKSGVLESRAKPRRRASRLKNLSVG